MPSQESVRDAKSNFVRTLQDGIKVLMNRCGYSRDRASSALLREITRGETTRPSDQEVFETMRQYRLGSEEVTKALIVSNAFMRAMESCSSPAEAIQCLASKISLSNLLYESSDEDPGVCDRENDFRSELRINPLSTAEPKSTPSRIKGTSTRKPKGMSKNIKSKLKTPNKLGLAGRKRSIDDMNPCLQSRDRSDSVSVEVDAKISKKSTDEPGPNETLRSSSNVRSKRHRTEDTEASVSSSSIKRALGNDD